MPLVNRSDISTPSLSRKSCIENSLSDELNLVIAALRKSRRKSKQQQCRYTEKMENELLQVLDGYMYSFYRIYNGEYNPHISKAQQLFYVWHQLFD
jgi:hypothetical protein